MYSCAGEKPEKKKKKKKKSGGSALWSEGGNVQLLSLAEKAGVEDTVQPEPEANEKGPDVAATITKSEETEAAAADDSEVKEEDKRVVTVATFGFPEVSIQPAEDDEGKETSEKKEEGKESQDSEKHGTESVSWF